MPSSYEKIKQYVEEEMRKKENGYPEETLIGPATKSYIFESTYGRHLDEKVHNLQQVSGKSIEQLIRLFAAGWTLNPPKEYTPNFREFLDSL